MRLAYEVDRTGDATLAGLAFSPETYACDVSMYGIGDLESFGKRPFANNEFWHDWVGNPFDQADIPMLKQASSINAIDQFKAPILLTTGSKAVVFRHAKSTARPRRWLTPENT